MAVTDVTVATFDVVDSLNNSAALGIVASKGGGAEMPGDDPELMVTFQEYR
jgi:hypothetical protein